MRIHFIVRTLNEKTGGGSHHNALAYIRFLKQKGHEVTIHAFAKEGTTAPDDLSITVHNFGATNFTVAHRALAKILCENQQNADVFFLYGVDFLWGGGLYRKEGGLVSVVVYLDTYLPSMNLGSPDAGSSFTRSLYRLKRMVWEKTVGRNYRACVDMYLAVSPFLEEVYVRYGFPAEKFKVLPNAFTLPETISRSVEVQAEVRLIYAGRIIRDKGIDLLIRALTKCREYAWTLTIVGSGPMLEKCKEMVRLAKLENQISFVPWVDRTKLAELYEVSDIFVHPARWPEPFGRTLVEAMSHSLSLIVPQYGAAAWVVDGAGISFQNGNKHDLEKALRNILTDPQLRMTLAAQGPSRAGEFNVSSVGPQLERLLQAVT
jgi:starch synthase